MALNPNLQLDELDLQILELLIKDCRTPYLEIARICHVSGGTIHVRMKKMEDMGIIKGSRILLDLAKLGYDVCCFFVGIYVNRLFFLLLRFSRNEENKRSCRITFNNR